MSDESETAVKNKDPNQPLKSLGKYVIERKLGQGGMGTVYLAKNTALKKLVALKVLPQDKAKNPTLVRRFKAEAQAAGKLEHPNIVAVYDSDEADGYLYIAMEFVDGIDLFEQVKRRGPIPVKQSIEIIKQVAAALQHAFEQNIVHRDIKPSNLLLKQDGTVKVTDLGLARSIDDTLETNITRAGTTVGTVDYMAPEQARSSKAADIRSDIYSLGCTWYQMLTGEPPYPEGSLTNKLQAHAIKPFPDPREKNERIPEGLIAILQRMTAKKPEDRYQTPAELLEDLATSKLTKAAFSNEIFSDLSDYEQSTLDDNDDDDEDEPEPVDERPRKRKQSRVEDDSAEEASTKSPRRKVRPRDTEKSPVDEAQAGSARKGVSSKPRNDKDDEDDVQDEQPRRRSRVDDDDDAPHDDSHRPVKRSRDGGLKPSETNQTGSSRKASSKPLADDDDDNMVDEPSIRRAKSRRNDDESEPPTPRRKPRSQPVADDHDDEVVDEPSIRPARSRSNDDNNDDETESPTPRRKLRSQDEDTSLVADTQPGTSRNKPGSHSRDEVKEGNDDVDDVGKGTNRTSKRGQMNEDEVPDDTPTNKRKKSLSTVAEEKPATAKNAKAVATKAENEKKAATPGQKPMPPKMQPAGSDAEEKVTLNIQSLKNFAIIAGLLTVVIGLGSIVYQWSNQVVTVTPPAAVQTPEAIAAATAPSKTHKSPRDPSETIVNAVDPPKVTTPERVPEFDITKQPVPGWAMSEATDVRDLHTISVGPGATSATHFSKLDDALRALDKNGTLVRLIGNGPFLMSDIDVASSKRVVITAASPQDQPLIIFIPTEAGAATGLSMSGGTLDLRGLHFAFNRAAELKSGSRPMVSVTDGQLYLRSCSFTATGSDMIPLTAVAFTSQQDAQNVPSLEPQFLMDRVTIRGNGLTGLHLNRTTAEVIIQDSLFVTGSSPAIDVDGQLVPAMAENILPKPRRTIRVFRSTFCARKHVMDLAAEDTLKPPTTGILFQDSVCTAEGAGNNAVLASATHWPSVSSTTSGWLTNLNWTSKSSLYLGFERLLDLDKSAYKVAKLDDWQRVWGKKFESIQFQPILWQESLIPDLSAVRPYDFEATKIPFRELKASTGNSPGCAIEQLRVPGVISQTRLAAISQRPKLPAIVAKPPEASQIKKIDLTKEDLGAILNKSDWQSGTVFDVWGSGLKMMSPVKISGKSLRIIFHSGDAAVLRLQPRVPDQKAKPDNPGLFNIENGVLDLQSAVLEASQTLKGATPPWLIHAKNSTVILQGCHLSGPLQQDLEQHQGLIRWSTSDAKPGAEPPFLAIKDSLLMSTGIGISSECAQGNIFLRNSIFAMRGHALNLVPLRIENRFLPMLDIEHVTFSTTKAAIRMESDQNEEIATSPMRLFVDYCAVIPPLEFKLGDAVEAAIVECVGPVRQRKQIEWWGNSNGVAKEVKTLLRQSGADSIGSASGWQSAWGDSNEDRFLSGTKGVVLNNNLPNKWTNLKFNSFALEPNCIGATWADGGRPIGADIRLVEDAVLGKKSSAEMKTPTTTGQPSKNPPTTGGKNNFGF